jgi:hypothetical protein
VQRGAADDDEKLPTDEEEVLAAMATPASMPRPAEATAIAATIFSLLSLVVGDRTGERNERNFI